MPSNSSALSCPGSTSWKASSTRRRTGRSSPSGCPTTSFVTELNTDVNPFTAFIDVEAPIGAGIQNLLDLTGIQQDLLDPVLGLVGSLGGLFTS
jgi:hypothetical protein